VKKISLIGFLCLFFSVFALFFSCKDTPFSPSPTPPPQPEKYYTLQIQYIRTYINPDVGATRTVRIYLMTLARTGDIGATLQITTDDYHLYGESWATPRQDYYFHCYDMSRYDGSDRSSVMVGDIFIITVKETGFVKELKDIRPYTLPTNAIQGPKARAAFFQLTQDGRIISEPQ